MKAKARKCQIQGYFIQGCIECVCARGREKNSFLLICFRISSVNLTHFWKFFEWMMMQLSSLCTELRWEVPSSVLPSHFLKMIHSLTLPFLMSVALPQDLRSSQSSLSSECECYKRRPFLTHILHSWPLIQKASNLLIIKIWILVNI